MIYFNQASTTYPKPDCVKQAVIRGIEELPASQSRSAASAGSSPMSDCRRALAQLFHIEHEERIFFTSGATDSFNRIVRGLSLDGKEIVITQMEHNAVLRPIYNIVHDAQIHVVHCDENGRLDLEELKQTVTGQTAAVFVNHCSNVTGYEVPLAEISRLVHEKGSILIADASQSAGHLRIDVKEQETDILVFTGHKGLFGPQGTGGFYVRPGIVVKQSVFGGTGRDSRTLVMQEDSQEQDAGTQNMQGIGALCAGVRFVSETGIEQIQKKESMLMKALRSGLERIPGVTVYGQDDFTGAVLSFNIEGLEAQDTAYVLGQSYDIILRSGLHCAPLIHEELRTQAHGTVRVSVSYMNTMQEVNAFLEAVKELTQQI